MELVENNLSISENKTGISVTENETISDETMQLIVDEFNFMEIFSDD